MAGWSSCLLDGVLPGQNALAPPLSPRDGGTFLAFPAAPNRSKLGAMPDVPAHPRDSMRPAWRAACLAYRKVRATGALDHPAHLAATAAVREVLPNPTEKEASNQAIAAIAYATTFHAEWFW